MRTEEFAALVAAIYDCALDSPAWQPFARKLAGAFDAESCLLHVRDPRANEAVILGATENLSGANGIAYAEYYYKTDVWAPRAARWGLDSAMVGADILGDREVLDSEFYRDYGRKVGAFDIAGALFSLGSERVGAVGIHRPHGAPAFDERDRARLSLLLPHLSRAMQLQRRLSDTRSGHLVAVEALNRMGCGVVLVGSGGHLLFANAVAERLLRVDDGISARHGKLRASDGSRDAELQRTIETARRTAVGASLGAGGILTVPRREGAPLSLLICPIPPDAFDLALSRHPVIIFIDNPDDRRAPASSLLAEVYGLSPAEARLAVALLQGTRLQDYADEAGVTLNTAKTQLKQVFAKTGDSRQSDLIRNLVSNLVLRMRSTGREE